MALQQTNAGAIPGPVRDRGGECSERFAILAVDIHRFVQQQRGGFRRLQARRRIHGDCFVRHLVLRLLDDLAIDTHPAALDVLLGFGAGTAGDRGDALGEAFGFGHGRPPAMRWVQSIALPRPHFRDCPGCCTFCVSHQQPR
jgi:hypothetical protein